ncbi:unnamed protein product [Hymenolepis diminuta]|uniref:[histone H3]-trimethyl-L-lysine(4) demethylase n=1 Tax=Hymenolepis diminuta TaxID=6216 RepID=A0A158QDH9_HYMDI|nr:unnamed protein product [Hymenolepis diminuta]
MPNFTFTPPPEAPVFHPTLKEFEDPLLYLEKIRPIGIKTGICKIIPPEGWKPPFGVDVRTFRFTPRIQRLYELEAHSRLELEFKARLYEFYQLNGNKKLKAPFISGQYLNLYFFFKYVMEEGGYDKVNASKLWGKIAEKLGFASTKYSQIMKTYYEKLLLKYELIMYHDPVAKNLLKRPAEGIVSTQSTPAKRTRSRNSEVQEGLRIDYSANKELRNLQFFGAGPKMSLPVTDSSSSVAEEEQKQDEEEENEGNERCKICHRGNNPERLMICSVKSCEAIYHTYCLNPPLQDVPTYLWKCPECIRMVLSRHFEPIGFAQSSRTYSLAEFGVHADAFKQKYFKRRPTTVPCKEVEAEYWRIMQDYSEDVIVEYGADVHASSHGSGFPTEKLLKTTTDKFNLDERRRALEYAQSPWNLNNLPLVGNSVLRFIKGNVDGMKVPWCYVGMVFSTFCWHIEDHWSCSINFNHWGEPKTWYGVSPEDAELFEQAMTKLAGELFDKSPDLLHHITTTMNPNLLQKEGVPIYRTDQHCGEFVVTFPRAYHAGFNQGFNFAEAVNVCPPAWLPIGRACVEHYAEMHRQCVFSNDELLYRLAEVISGRREMTDVANYTEMVAQRYRDHDSSTRTCFDVEDLRVIHSEFSTVIGHEMRARQDLLPRVKRAVKYPVYFLAAEDDDEDDDRICAVCQTTLFFSTIVCPCKAPPYLTKMREGGSVKKRGSEPAAPSCADGKPNHAFMVCLEHADKVCENCPLSECTLYYTHDFEDLESMRDAIATRMNDYDNFLTTFAPFFLPEGSSTLNASTTNSSENGEKSRSLTSKSLPVVAKIPLATFEKQLKAAQLFGYKADELYKRTNSYVESVKELLRICERASEFILGQNKSVVDKLEHSFTGGEGNNKRSGRSGQKKKQPKRRHECERQQQQEEEEQQVFEFQMRRRSSSKPGGAEGKVVTHIQQHSIDFNNPREADFLSLLSAIDLEEAAAPINFTRKPRDENKVIKDDTEDEDDDELLPCIANLRCLFIELLPALRGTVLSLLEKAGSETEISSSSVTKIYNNLVELVVKLKLRFPGWSEFSEEVRLVSLVSNC